MRTADRSYRVQAPLPDPVVHRPAGHPQENRRILNQEAPHRLFDIHARDSGSFNTSARAALSLGNLRGSMSGKAAFTGNVLPEGSRLPARMIRGFRTPFPARSAGEASAFPLGPPRKRTAHACFSAAIFANTNGSWSGTTTCHRQRRAPRPILMDSASSATRFNNTLQGFTLTF